VTSLHVVRRATTTTTTEAGTFTKVTAFGATGAIGGLVVDHLLQAGHDVLAYVRNPDKVPRTGRPTASTSSSEPSSTQPPSTMLSAAGRR
jgi:NAD dependent epimerase/dehydratase family enzyme